MTWLPWVRSAVRRLRQFVAEFGSGRRRSATDVVPPSPSIWTSVSWPVKLLSNSGTKNDMSRRKQAKPRALKRGGEWGSEDAHDHVPGNTDQDQGPSLMANMNICLPETPTPCDPTNDRSATNTGEAGGEPEGDGDCSATYRCETCGTHLESLKSFMDHRNFDCLAGDCKDPASWPSDNADGDDQSLSPSSCATPTGVDPDPDLDLSFTVGVTEGTPYACQFCTKAFPRLSYLKRHEQSHSDQMPFKCDFCHRLFKHKRSRDRHVKLHTGDKKYRCPHCDSAFSRSDHLKIHMKTHDNAKPFQCTVCNRGYNTAAALTSHMQNHKKELLGVRCPICPVILATPHQLQAHLAGHSSPESPADKSLDDATCTGIRSKTSSPLDMCNSPRLSCAYCTKDGFSTVDALQLHVQAMHGTISNGDAPPCHAPIVPAPCSPRPSSKPATSSKPSQLRSSSPPTSTPLGCHFCTMTCTSVTALQKHTLSVHSFSDVLASSSSSTSDVYCCPHCTLGLQSAATLADHIRLAHGGSGNCSSPSTAATTITTATSPSSTKAVDSDKPSTTLLCNQCNAAFPEFEAFRAHLKTHLDEASVPKLSCPECQAEMATDEQLDAHAASHFLSAATEYGCQKCLKLFAKPDDLQKHLMDIHAHHLYRCALCRDVFDSKVSVQVHFAVKHSNECRLFRCTACASVFRSEMEFQLHVKVSHLRKALPFRCLFCSFAFASELELQCHLTTHQKQFPCTLCDEAFHVEFLLDRHIQAKHASDVAGGALRSTPPAGGDCQVSQVTGAPSKTSSAKAKRTATTTPPPSAQPQPPPPTTATTASTIAPPTSNHGHQSVVNQSRRCEVCDWEATSESGLAAHRRQAHALRSSGSGSSGTCGASGSKSNSSGGCGGHPILSLYCAYCNEACKSRSELENHMKVHTVNCGKHKCNICDEVCPTATTLAEHKLTHCKVVSGSTCVACKVTLKSEEQYYAHLQQHHNQGLPLPCVVCRQTLMTDVEVQMHVKFHLMHAQPPRTCCICRKALDLNCNVANGTSAATSLLCKSCFRHGRHDDVTTSNATTYQCIKCQMSFSTEEEVQAHVATHVLAEGLSLECRLCPRIFDSPAKLQCHLIEHNFEGGSAFVCYLCGTSFAAAASLQQHVLEHGLHARPYGCSKPHCHQRFFFRAELKHHVLCHSSEQSTITTTSATANKKQRTSRLGKRSRQRCDLLGGVVKVKTDRPFTCAQCGKVFSRRRHATEHLRKVHSVVAVVEGEGDLEQVEEDGENDGGGKRGVSLSASSPSSSSCSSSEGAGAVVGVRKRRSLVPIGASSRLSPTVKNECPSPCPKEPLTLAVEVNNGSS